MVNTSLEKSLGDHRNDVPFDTSKPLDEADPYGGSRYSDVVINVNDVVIDP